MRNMDISLPSYLGKRDKSVDFNMCDRRGNLSVPNTTVRRSRRYIPLIDIILSVLLLILGLETYKNKLFDSYL